MHPLTQQLIILTLLRVLRMFMIAVPVIAIYWEGFGLSMQDIMILQVIFAITLVTLEMPSGWLADRYGNKPVIIAGCIFGVIGYLVFLLSPTYLGFVVGEMILAVGASLLSGARESLLYNTLSAFDREADYTNYHGQQMTWGLMSEAIAGITATILVTYQTQQAARIGSEIDLSIVLLAEILVLSLAVTVACCLRSFRTKSHSNDSLAKTIRYCFYGNKRLLWLNIMTGTVSASTLTMFWYTQLHWQSLGIPLVYNGLILSGLLLLAAGASYSAGWIEKHVRFRILFATFAIAPLLLYGVMALLSQTLLSFVILTFFWWVRGTLLPITSTYVQREAKPENRATVLSANALVGRLVFTVTSPFLGAAVDIWSFGTAFIFSAGVFGSLALLSYIQWLKTIPAD